MLGATSILTNTPINSQTFDLNSTNCVLSLQQAHPCFWQRKEEIPRRILKCRRGRRGEKRHDRSADCINKLKAYQARQNTIDGYAWPLQIFSLRLFRLACTERMERLADRSETQIRTTSEVQGVHCVRWDEVVWPFVPRNLILRIHPLIFETDLNEVNQSCY